MIIEFYGLPGSGKTTIAKNLSQKTDFKIVKIRKKSELLFYNLIFLFKHPIFFLKSFFYILKNSKSKKELYYKFMNAFLDYNAKYEKALKNKNSILDQSFYQNVISLFNHRASEKEIKSYLKFVPKTDILFVFQLDKNERQERVKQRGVGIREEFDFYNKKWFDNMEINNNSFIKILSDLDVKYFVLDSRQNQNDLVNIVLNKIKNEK